LVLRESDGKKNHDLTRLANSDIWKENRFDEIKDRQIITICRIQRLHLITGTVALVNITKQTKIYHYINTGKYCIILQILILGLFTEVLLILILMLSIQNLILIYWYFQYFTVSVFYVLNHQLSAVI
jgi:hypothetical protein